MQKPKEILEMEERARQLNIQTDILDDLQSENGFVELTLSTGEKVFGKPDCITWDGEEELDKHIRFIPYFSTSRRAVYYGIEDIVSYVPCTREEIEHKEAFRNSSYYQNLRKEILYERRRIGHAIDNFGAVMESELKEALERLQKATDEVLEILNSNKML